MPGQFSIGTNFSRWSTFNRRQQINAFNAVTGLFEGPPLDACNKPNLLTIDGHWAISFGGGNSKSGASNELYFNAVPNDEGGGFFGKLTADPTEQKGNT